MQTPENPKALNPKPYKPETLNTLNPAPETLNPKQDKYSKPPCWSIGNPAKDGPGPQHRRDLGASRTVGALIIRIGLWSPLYYSYNNEPPPQKKRNSVGNY